MFESFVHFGHFEAFRDRCNLVPGAKIDHFLDGRRTSHRRTGKRFLAGDQRKGGELYRFVEDAHGHEAPLGSKRFEILLAIKRESFDLR
jgi:hypothetical protein